LVALLCIASVALAVPEKPQWPPIFNVKFGVYALAGMGGANPALINVSSNFWYDWTRIATLIEYPVQCIPIGGELYKRPCNLLFNTNGTFLIAPQSGIPCCLAFPGVGPIPPDFLKAFNYSGLPMMLGYDIHGELHETELWTTLEGFFYWTDKKTGTDIQLIDGGSIAWNFEPKLSADPQPRDVYQQPDHCPPCPNSFAALLRDPMITLTRHHFESLQV